METCIKLMQLVFNKMIKTLELVIQVAKTKDFNNSNLEKLQRYNTNLRNFTDYTNNLTTKDFEQHIKEIFERVKKLIQYFSIDVVKMIQEYNIQDAINSLKGLPQSIVQLLAAFRIYIEKANEDIKNNRDILVDKMKEYRNSNNKSLNESIDISSLLILSEEESQGFINSFASGGVGAVSGLFKMFSFKSDKIAEACKSFDGSLDNLNKAAIAADKSSNFLSFFRSDAFASTLGGILALIVSFALVKKIFTKIINFIKNTWNGFWEWTRR